MNNSNVVKNLNFCSRHYFKCPELLCCALLRLNQTNEGSAWIALFILSRILYLIYKGWIFFNYYFFLLIFDM